MDDEARLSLARGFTYDGEARAEIDVLIQDMVGSGRHNHVIDDLQAIVRSYIVEYVQFPKTGRKARRRHYDAVSRAAANLQTLLEDTAALEGGGAAYLIRDIVQPDTFKRAVADLAQRAGEWAMPGAGYPPGMEPGTEEFPPWLVDGKNNVRIRIARDSLQLYRQISGKAPTSTANGSAVKWLMATVDPAMEFARLKLGEDRAREMGENGAVQTILTLREWT